MPVVSTPIRLFLNRLAVRERDSKNGMIGSVRPLPPNAACCMDKRKPRLQANVSSSYREWAAPCFLAVSLNMGTGLNASSTSA